MTNECSWAPRAGQRGGGGTEGGAERERARREAPSVHGSHEAPCVAVRTGGDVRGEERVPGDRVGAGDLVEHAARGGEAEAEAGGGGVRGEEPVPGRGRGDAGLD